MKTIVFWDNCLCERGTTIALFDYAYYNEKILNNKSIIMYNTKRIENQKDVIEKFEKHFNVIGVDNFNKVDPILKDNNCDIFYIIKAGEYEGQVSKVCKSVVHCVFNTNQPHGDVYARVSPYVYGKNGNYPVVPHMINLPNNTDNMRSELNIPENAVVFGRHGGYGQFDIHFVHKIVYNVALMNPNIYFLFLNTQKFCDELPNIIHLTKIIDLEKKVKFINTCDAMLWARRGGETYGLSIAEFSTKNKPVLCCDIGDNAHINYLGNKAIIYNESNLQNIIVNFNKEEILKQEWNAYTEYTPEKVMKIFKQVFIDK
jgi:hypothetical protein